MATIKPVGEQILVKRYTADDTTEGGIILPDNAKAPPQEGRVLAVGQGRLNESGTYMPFMVKPGDHILFANYAGQEVEYAGEKHLLMKEDQIFAVIDEGDPVDVHEDSEEQRVGDTAAAV